MAGQKDVPNKIDGIDQWQSLLKSEKSPRSEMLYNIDPITQNNYNDKNLPRSENFNAGIRYEEMKLLIGNPGIMAMVS